MNYEIQEDGKFKFIATGKGEPLMLLHGLFGALSNFADLINHFSKNYEVIVPILPLLELRPPPSHQILSLELWELLVRRPVIIVGQIRERYTARRHVLDLPLSSAIVEKRVSVRLVNLDLCTAETWTAGLG